MAARPIAAGALLAACFTCVPALAAEPLIVPGTIIAMR